jgi:hypothetical protein
VQIFLSILFSYLSKSTSEKNHEYKITSKRHQKENFFYVQRTPLQDDEDDYYSLRLAMFCGWEITCNYSYCLLQIMRLFNLIRVGVGNEKIKED